MAQCRLNGQMISYTVRRSQRAKYLRLEISPLHGLQVVVPRGGSLSQIPAVLQRRAPWILRHLQKLKKSEPPSQTSLLLQEGQQLPFLGESLTFRLLPLSTASSRTVPGEILQSELRLFLPSSHPAWNDLRQRVLLVEEVYREEARKHFTQQSHYWAQRMQVTFHRITIKEQKSRWGSCSRQGNLHFNWRLMMAPASVVDYVVVHELAHRLQMNHSSAFWDIVRRYVPDFEKHRRWLKEHGHQLWH